jgi:hypothetical protein
MKFLKGFTKKIILMLALLSLSVSMINSAYLKNSELKTLESEGSSRHKSRSKRHVFLAQTNPPYKNNTNYTLGYTLETSVNNSASSINLKDFKRVNLNSKFHAMFDKQLEEIFLIFKNKKTAGVSDFRNSYSLFIKYFNACDKDNDLLLNENEFSACMTNDPYLSLVQQPQGIFSVMRNFTNSTGYNSDIYKFTENYDQAGINFYDYVILRLFTFAWRKCTISNNFMDESTFECAIDITSGTKSLNTNTLRSIFQLGLSLTNTNSMPVRTFDFVTYYALATSIRLFGKINAKENFDATIAEFNIALDDNILPKRYNQDIINQLFRLTNKDANSKNGIDLYSFIYYDHFLKLFYSGATANRWTITPAEFAKICSFWLFPQNIFNGMKQVPLSNITNSNYNLRAHIQEIHFDEEENFSKFLELSTKTKAQVKRYNNTNFNLTQVDNSIFNLLDSNSDNVLTFYDFGNFVQTFALYYKTDSRHSDRIIVSDIATAFTEYSDLPLYSSEFRARSKRFNLIEPDLYIDPFYTLAITRMDDYVQHFIRRIDPTTVKEIELNLILNKMNLKNFPSAYLIQCVRGKDSNGIPIYDWECALTTAITRVLKYFEYSRDISDIQQNGLNLTYTDYDYANSK